MRNRFQAFAFNFNMCCYTEGCWEEMLEGLTFIEECMGKKLGDPAKPLLLSVRSGAAVSMPGMMDTVLNLGLNDTVVGLYKFANPVDP